MARRIARACKESGRLILLSGVGHVRVRSLLVCMSLAPEAGSRRALGLKGTRDVRSTPANLSENFGFGVIDVLCEEKRIRYQGPDKTE